MFGALVLLILRLLDLVWCCVFVVVFWTFGGGLCYNSARLCFCLSLVCVVWFGGCCCCFWLVVLGLLCVVLGLVGLWLLYFPMWIRPLWFSGVECGV